MPEHVNHTINKRHRKCKALSEKLQNNFMINIFITYHSQKKEVGVLSNIKKLVCKVLCPQKIFL